MLGSHRHFLTASGYCSSPGSGRVLAEKNHLARKEHSNQMPQCEEFLTRQFLLPVVFQGMLQFLQRLVYSTALCGEGDWSIGSAVLAVCQSLLIYHNNAQNFTGKKSLQYRCTSGRVTTKMAHIYLT